MASLHNEIASSMDGILDFANGNTVIGSAIVTHDGVTVIPVSRVSVTGIGVGFDSDGKRSTDRSGEGGGANVIVTPTAFLCVAGPSDIRLISVKEKEKSNNSLDRVVSFAERAPNLFRKIKEVFTGPSTT